MADVQLTSSQLAVERWRGIPGFPDYEASDMGRIRSITRVKPHPVNGWKTYRGRVLAQAIMPSGHRTVSVINDEGQCKRLVHRLVLTAFVGPCPEGMEACHSNDNPCDNRLANLRWAPRRDNNLDRVRNGIHSMANKTHCKRGHEFTTENTRIEHRPNGDARRCRACERERCRRRKQRARELRQAQRDS